MGRILLNNYSTIRGVVAIELALIIPVMLVLFAGSWQVGRYLYWQQHFDLMTLRFSKILAHQVAEEGTLSQNAVDDLLDIANELPRTAIFDIGIQATLLSDDPQAEKEILAGDICPGNHNTPVTISELPPVNLNRTVRYWLGITLCATPQHWGPTIIPDIADISSFNSQSYYPVSRVAP